jgi:hypothetical protein
MNRTALPAFGAILGALLAVSILLLWRRSATLRSEEERFRDTVLVQMRAEFPAQSFQPVADDPMSIRAGDFRINLNNARRQYEQSAKTDQALRDIVKEFKAFWPTTEVANRFPKTYEEARRRLLPQFMPSAIASDEAQVRMPFAGNVVLGIVVDDDRSYSCLKRETLKNWGQTEEVAFADALNNLDTRSHGMQMRQFKQFGATFFAVSMRDGFDAARIAVPKLRTAFGRQLGHPFYFGIPNREFLICWSAEGGSEVLEFARGKLRGDFQKQPYPISSSIFQVTADGKVTQLQETEEPAKPKTRAEKGDH